MPTDLCSMVDTGPVRALAPSAHTTVSTSTHTADTARCLVRWRNTNPHEPIGLMLVVNAYYFNDVAGAKAEYDGQWDAVVGPTGSSTEARTLTGFGRPAFAAWVQLKDAGSVDVYVRDSNLVLKVVLTVEDHDAIGTTGPPAASAVARTTPPTLRNRQAAR
ncbi:hypothetical protein [Actinocatenispora rupis]|uniref:Uncharacterized protein n=1 Tax=Actinocatenispora rupis TaxID=519421 RepID=A0A8J3NC89_9ACTN|nr:hypothetical protein [Actinocatenispora rupis]GID10169.1 hypothetical protein Aru02nite_10580 [Actinocatenispora rupis]